MSELREYDFTETLQELDAGVFVAKLSAAIKEVAAGTMTFGGVGVVSVDFAMKKIGESGQVMLSHTLKFKKPTMRGDAGERSMTSTALYVGKDGRITIMPDTQNRLDFQTEPQP